MQWKIIDSGTSSAEKNMQIDRELLQKGEGPILHLYDWEKKSATFGYFIDPYLHLKKEALKKNAIEIAKRPTGGGILFHLSDFAFSLLIPATHPAYSINTLENYARVHLAVREILKGFLPDEPTLVTHESSSQDLSFCMAKPTKYDLLIGGKKVGGAAQRRTRRALLHQGTISLGMPPKELLKEVLLNPEPLISAMEKHTYFTPLDLVAGRQTLKSLFLSKIHSFF